VQDLCLARFHTRAEAGGKYYYVQKLFRVIAVFH